MTAITAITRSRRFLRGLLLILFLIRNDVDLAAADIHVEGLDLVLGRAGDYASGAHIELRPVPGTHSGAADEGAVGERPALVGAMIAESGYAFGAAADDDAPAGDFDQHHLAFCE